MKKSILGYGLLVAAVPVALAVMGAGPAPVTAEVGKAAPAFSLPDTNGKAHALEDYEGKWVVLEWTNHLCPIVVRHYKDGGMQATQKWAKDKGVVWLQVVSSAPGKQGHVSADQAKSIMKEGKYNSAAMLFDPNGEVGKAYGAQTTPHMYIISPKGELLYNGAIDNNSNGRASEVVNYVKQGLTEAMAGKDVSVKTSRPYGCGVKY